MTQFENILRNQFENRVSDDQLHRYGQEHIRRMDAAKSYTTIVEITREKYDAYFGSISQEDALAALSKGSTSNKDETRDALLSSISRYEGAIRATWGKDSPEYIRFFPRGLTEYRKATLDNIDSKITRFESALQEIGDPLAADVLDAFLAPTDPADPDAGGTIVRFREAREAQLKAKGQTDEQKRDAAIKRKALEWQLMINLYTVAIEIADQSEEERIAALRLFPQHLIRSARKRKSVSEEKGEAVVENETTDGAETTEAVAADKEETHTERSNTETTEPANVPLVG